MLDLGNAIPQKRWSQAGRRYKSDNCLAGIRALHCILCSQCHVSYTSGCFPLRCSLLLCITQLTLLPAQPLPLLQIVLRPLPQMPLCPCNDFLILHNFPAILLKQHCLFLLTVNPLPPLSSLLFRFNTLSQLLELPLQPSCLSSSSSSSSSRSPRCPSPVPLPAAEVCRGTIGLSEDCASISSLPSSSSSPVLSCDRPRELGRGICSPLECVGRILCLLLGSCRFFVSSRSCALIVFLLLYVSHFIFSGSKCSSRLGIENDSRIRSWRLFIFASIHGLTGHTLCS